MSLGIRKSNCSLSKTVLLDQYRVVSEQFHDDAGPAGSLGKVGHAFIWKFNKSNVESMLEDGMLEKPIFILS